MKVDVTPPAPLSDHGWWLNRPVPFPGTPSWKKDNYETHHFLYDGGPDDGDVRCTYCDCRPSHTAASYPCGSEPPREWVWIDTTPIPNVQPDPVDPEDVF